VTETLPRPNIETPLPEADGPQPAKRLFTREEYHRAAEAGVFTPDERLELMNGEIYKKTSPQKSGHSFVIRALDELLTDAFGRGFDVRPQLPLQRNDNTEPEPDVSVVPGSWKDYQNEHPPLTRAVLIAEVSDTSLRADRGIKAALYAEAGVPDYWIVNLKDRVIEVYREPSGAPSAAGAFAYKSARIYHEGESLAPLSALKVTDLLPSS
jgi:Uma2 family endonuclease